MLYLTQVTFRSSDPERMFRLVLPADFTEESLTHLALLKNRLMKHASTAVLFNAGCLEVALEDTPMLPHTGIIRTTFHEWFLKIQVKPEEFMLLFGIVQEYGYSDTDFFL